MTAEIAIMNMKAIALAADSAVTITSGRGQKVRTSAEKIFRLSKHAPVGIMSYGSAKFMNVPWEVIINSYRDNLDTTTFSTLKEYTDNFIEFLQKENSLFPSSLQEEFAENYIYSHLHNIASAIDNEIEKFLDKNIRITKSKVKEITKKIIETNFNRWKNAKRIQSLPTNHEKVIKETYIKYIEEQKKKLFSDISLTKPLDKKLIESAISIFIKERFRDDYSGIVIAGFGNKDDFPIFYELKFDMKVKGHVKYQIFDSGKITHKNTASIAPFAQRDMADVFVTGINPDYRKIITQLISDICNSYPKIVIDLLSNKLNQNDKTLIKKQLMIYKKNIFEKANKKFEYFEDKNFIQPVVRAVALLNKSELAEMAESLVYLTSLKRKISPDIESVGGPIDVVLISKSEGFIWIKRKDYFEPEKNPQFMAKYISEKINIGGGYEKNI